MSASIYDIEVESIGGGKRTLETYRGRVLLIVNTASKDLFTPQYAGLETLHRELGGRGLTVLAFPCDQFGRGEPGNAKEIESFVKEKYAVSFPMHAKIDVIERDAHVLYRYLCAAKKSDVGDKDVRDNFEKFLVDRQGKVVGRYDARTTPEKLRPAIEKLL
jgi:glutathione peroxidase